MGLFDGLFGPQEAPQQAGPQLPPMNPFIQSLRGGLGGGQGALGGFASPALFAALIGMGKNTEANHPNSPVGQGLLAGLGPSIAQVKQDPLGMGLPTALGLPFITPWTGSKQAQATRPEWSGLFHFGF